MANNKKSAILYCDLIHTVKKLSDQNAGILFKHYLSYINDEDPIAPNELIDLVFEPIKQQLKRDLKHWESVIDKRKIAGAKGGKQKVANAKSAKQSLANVAVNVNDNVNVNVNVNDNVSLKSKLEIWLEELEGSSHIEQIAMNQSLTVVQVKARLQEFKPKMNVDYKNFTDFANHFKNWLGKNPNKQITKTQYVRYTKDEDNKW